MHKALDYRGRCVVITGAAGGIGRGLAQSFAAAGATLELLDRDADALARLADELAGDTPLRCTALDLGDRQAVQQYADDLACRGLNARSEENTSELQSLMRNSYAVFCLKQ